MDEKIQLNDLALNKSAVISSVECKEHLKNRIFDLGIIEGEEIIPIFKSPFGDPTAYLVKKAVIAIRNNDSKHIVVIPK